MLDTLEETPNMKLCINLWPTIMRASNLSNKSTTIVAEHDVYRVGAPIIRNNRSKKKNIEIAYIKRLSLKWKLRIRLSVTV